MCSFVFRVFVSLWVQILAYVYSVLLYGCLAILFSIKIVWARSIANNIILSRLLSKLSENTCWTCLFFYQSYKKYKDVWVSLGSNFILFKFVIGCCTVFILKAFSNWRLRYWSRFLDKYGTIKNISLYVIIFYLSLMLSSVLSSIDCQCILVRYKASMTW